MKQLFLPWLLAVAAISATAQQKIQDGTGMPATSLPAAGSLLELQSIKAGLRLPQVALTSSGSWAPLTGSPTAATSKGMFVYNTATSSDVTPGIYYWDGVQWQRGSNSVTNTNVFTAGAPTGTGTTGVIYTDTLSGSATQGQQYVWSGTAYVGYTSPAATEWNILGGTSDAASNKTAAISRPGGILVGSNVYPPTPWFAAGVITVRSSVLNQVGLNCTDGTNSIFMLPNTGATAYNSITQTGDAGIYWGDPTGTPRAISFGPWTNVANNGVRFTASGVIQATGYNCRNGMTGPFGNTFNIWWNGANAHLIIDNSDLGAITTTSDRRLKENIEPLGGDALSRVMQLRPVSFQYKKVDATFTGSDVVNEGFIADEIQAVIPSAVNGEKDALTKDGKIQPQTLNMAPILSVLTKAVQELQVEIEAMKKKNTVLAAQNAELQAAVLELRNGAGAVASQK